MLRAIHKLINLKKIQKIVKQNKKKHFVTSAKHLKQPAVQKNFAAKPFLVSGLLPPNL